MRIDRYSTEPEKLSNYKGGPFRFVIQSCNSGMWVDTRFGANTVLEAQAEAERVLGEDNHWTNPSADRKLRVVTLRK